MDLIPGFPGMCSLMWVKLMFLDSEFFSLSYGWQRVQCLVLGTVMGTFCHWIVLGGIALKR